MIVKKRGLLGPDGSEVTSNMWALFGYMVNTLTCVLLGVLSVVFLWSSEFDGNDDLDM